MANEIYKHGADNTNTIQTRYIACNDYTNISAGSSTYTTSNTNPTSLSGNLYLTGMKATGVNGTGGIAYIYPLIIPNKSTIQSISITYTIVGTTRSVAIKPQLTLIRAPSTLITNVNTTFNSNGIFTQSGSAAYSINNAFAPQYILQGFMGSSTGVNNAAAYPANVIGTYTTTTWSDVQLTNTTIDNDNYRYQFWLTEEAGANSVPGNIFWYIKVNYIDGIIS